MIQQTREFKPIMEVVRMIAQILAQWSTKLKMAN